MIDKSKAFEALRADFADNPLVSERTIEEVLENLMLLTNDDTDEEKFLEYATSILKTSEGNARKVAAETAKKIKAEKKPAPQKKVETDEPDKEEEDDAPAWAKKVLEELGTVKQKLADDDKRKTAEQIKVTAYEKAKSLYPENVIDVAADGFDFGQEGAESIFIEKVNRTASKIGVVPQKGEPKEQKPDFSKLRAEIERNDELLK
jgi:hypothetical protein